VGLKGTDGRLATVTPLADAITAIDTIMTGEPELNAVYLIDCPRPTLVEAGPGADHDVIVEALGRLGVGPGDLAHIVVTHIHLDHAGGAGALSQTFPDATVWVHEQGAAHLEDPTRLVASTARTYGVERMGTFFGSTVPVPTDRLHSMSDGDRIDLGDRTIRVVATPGHASHHVALHESAGGAMFTGEAVGSHLPWADAYRPALPPPEVDVELALSSIERIRASTPTALLTSHFGPISDADDGCDRAAQRIIAWSDTVRRAMRVDPGVEPEALADLLLEQAEHEFRIDSTQPFERERYDALGSIAMNAAGLQRYWRKRWEREAGEGAGSEVAGNGS
jgi:glyoxylase-like metal-dependent hydrolase (beta-lactamase superfamily II)